MVASTRVAGLKQVKTLHRNTPSFVGSYLVSIHNTYHGGSGVSFIDLAVETLRVESSWRADCASTGVNSSHPKYAFLYLGCP
jgi:hypothetical protein